MPDGIAFASELKALLVLGELQIDPSAVRDFLFHGYVPAPKTIYRGIAKLPAGHTLTWAEGRVQIERYWRPSTAIEVRTADDTLHQLDELLREVVPAHTLSDVPVGVFLSGGMDSALTAYYLDAPRTYSLGFEARDRSELDAARRAATHLNTVHTEMTAQAENFSQALEAIPGLFDEPFGDSGAWSNYLIAQCARREVTVALSGEGGDEIFCGYPRYWSNIGARSNALNRSLARLLPPLSRFASSAQRHAYVGLPAFAAALGGMTAIQIDALLGSRWREPDYDYLWFYRQFWREDLNPLVQLRWLDLNTGLAEGLLTKVDRSSMAHSLEVRPPLLDHRLVEYMLSVDPALLVDERRRRGKLLVRKLHGAAVAGGAPGSAQVRDLGCRCIAGSRAILSCCRRRCGGSWRAVCSSVRWAPSFAEPGRSWCSIVGSPPLTEFNPRILFVPVSGPYGMGEYARSAAIARAVRQRWTNAEIRFVLSRVAPYAADASFPATLLPSSPTFHSAAVIDLIRTWRPHVVIFDNAGRAAQLKAARRSGAHVIYISARQRQRRKAFSWRWMPLIDEHWIAYPEFLAGKLRFLERFKLKLLRGPRVRYLDVIFSRAGAGSHGRGVVARGIGGAALRVGGTGRRNRTPGRARRGGAIPRGRPHDCGVAAS